MERNLRLAFGDRLETRSMRRIIARATLENWLEIFSYEASDADRALIRDAEVRGLEHLQAGLRQGRGVVVWESALGLKLTAKRILHERGHTMYQVHAARHLAELSTGGTSDSTLRRFLIRAFFESRERQVVADIIIIPSSDSLSFARQIRKRLEENAIVFVTGDAKDGQRLLPAELFGAREYFATGMLSVARLHGTPVLPAFCYENDDGSPRLIIEPAIGLNAGDSRDEALADGVAQYARILERHIREHPDRYRHWHQLGSELP